jgi:hypothetical protein
MPCPASKHASVATVVAAPLAALATWALFRVAGVTFHVSTGDRPVGADDVAVVAAVAALLGWIGARALESRLQRPRLWWVRVGTSCRAASIVGPSLLAGNVDSVALMALHLVTPAAIVVGFAATLPVPRHPSRYATSEPETSSPPV